MRRNSDSDPDRDDSHRPETSKDAQKPRPSYARCIILSASKRFGHLVFARIRACGGFFGVCVCVCGGEV